MNSMPEKKLHMGCGESLAPLRVKRKSPVVDRRNNAKPQVTVPEDSERRGRSR